MHNLSKEKISEIYNARKTKLYDDGYEYAINLIQTKGGRSKVFHQIEAKNHHQYFLNGMKKAYLDETSLLKSEVDFNEGFLNVKNVMFVFS